MKLVQRFSRSRWLRRALVYLMTYCILFNASLSVVLAGPEGAEVINGQVTFQQSGNNTVITASDRSVVNYSGFDITSPEIVEFIQPSSAASVLNRILSANPTHIDGTLLANGRVFFVNPAGVFIGSGAAISVNQLVASGLDIANEDFINGRYHFAGGKGDVANYGDIRAESVYLVGKTVTNAGTITSPGGYVVMAAGDRVFLGEPGSSVVVEVDAVDGDQAEGADVTNEGTIDAPGGEIVLAAGDIFSRAITNTGTLSAAGGKVTAKAARVNQAGIVSVDGIEGDGGTVDLIVIEVVFLDEDSLTTANGGPNGDGGEVTVYSKGTAVFSEGAMIEVKGGSESGDGGFAEISGEEDIELHGFVDAGAPEGKAGTFLIDPHDVTISSATHNPPSNIEVDWLEDQLNNYLGDVVIDTSAPGTDGGDITVLDAIANWNSINSLTLDAHRDIVVEAEITNAGTGGLTLEANRHINVNADISTGGDIGLYADDNGNIIGDMHSADGVALTAGGNINIRGNDIVLGGPVKAGVDGSGEVTLDKDLIIVGRDCFPDPDPEWGDVWAKSTLEAGGDIEISVTGQEKHWVGCGCCGEWEYSYHPGTITLDDDVTAGENLRLFNDTWTAPGVTLQAGQDVFLVNDNAGPTEKDNCTTLTGSESLAIVAGAGEGVTDGEIHADNTTISVTGSSLTLQQDQTLDTADYLFAGQATTHLTLISNEGSAISTDDAAGGKDDNAADEWASVGAEAKEDIDLVGDGKIRTRELLSHEGDITVESRESSLLAMEDITAEQGNVTLKADNVIHGWADIFAGQNVNLESPLVLLGGEWVWDEGLDAWVWQGDQHITAENGTLTASEWIKKKTPGELHMYGGDSELAIDLLYRGDLCEETPTVATAGNLYMLGNGDIQISGDISTVGDYEAAVYNGLEIHREDPPEGEAIEPPDRGGVSIISQNGKIYTRPEGDGPVDGDYWLDVTIEGFSDDVSHREWEGEQEHRSPGVELPYGPGKAAVVLVSKEDLKFGADSDVRAYGRYALAEVFSVEGVDNWEEFDFYDEFLLCEFEPFIGDYLEDFFAYAEGLGYDPEEDFWPGDIEDRIAFAEFKGLLETFFGDETVLAYLDDRAGVGFLDEPANIGDFDREEGLPIDVAIYAQSTEGDVIVDVASELPCDDCGPDATGTSGFWVEPQETCDDCYDQDGGMDTLQAEAQHRFWGESRGMVVLDAQDTVEFDFDTTLHATAFMYWLWDESGYTDFADLADDIADFLSFWENEGFGYIVDIEGFLADHTDLGDFADFADFLYTFTAYVNTDLLVAALEDWGCVDDCFKGFGDWLLGFRNMTVVSRRTEWLQDAVDNRTLPFADNSELIEWFLGGSYVLRGAGADNPEIGDGAPAWVLEDPAELLAAPPLPEMLVWEVGGCPSLMEWLADELGVAGDKIQVYLLHAYSESQNAVGSTTTVGYKADIQLCLMCERLRDAAAMLAGAEADLATLAQAVNAGTPPAPESLALVAQAVPGQWLEALVEYVGILNTDLGWSVSDSAMLVADKYVVPVIGGDATAVAAYLEGLSQASGG